MTTTATQLPDLTDRRALGSYLRRAERLGIHIERPTSDDLVRNQMARAYTEEKASQRIRDGGR